MLKFLEYAMVIVAACVCILVLMQDSAIDNNLISAFSNKRLSLFSNNKERGSAKIIMIVTYIFVALFMAMAIAIMVLSRKG